MTSWERFGAFAFAALALAGFAGCGGGGSSSRARVAAYASDDFSDDYSQVWATILKVELIDAQGNSAVLFDDAAGNLVDLASLHDATGPRYSFLGTGSIPTGNYVKSRVTFKPTLSLLPKNGTTLQTVEVHANVARDSAGNAVVTHNLEAERHFAEGDDDLVVDFDLARFNLSGGKLIPTLVEGSRSGLRDKSRHESDDWEGTVSGLSGTFPSQTFTIARGSTTLAVVTSDATVVYSKGTAAGAMLANGQKVEVRGVFDAAARTISATSVKIEDSSSGSSDSDEVKGAPSDIDAANAKFKVTIEKAEGFVPDRAVVSVSMGANAIYRGERGAVLTASDFFNKLSSEPYVEVEGLYDPATGILTATRAKLEHGRPGHEHEDGNGNDDDDHGDHHGHP